ncbi:HDOD domain-containing protein [uncultured Desulfobacter sp.]|uniref:HDOD domain-containing protein n=1 Tax=uncultured Desulfobacter sp. TaxID=240139 RepID=UPI0029F5978C|nr:HDOD domain-containing protein [uncultured Desulfobacter sp.]
MNPKASILETLREYISNQKNFPVLHPDAATIQDEITKKDPELSRVKQLIIKDPTLTGEILKVANSSYYKGLGEVSTIKEAALRLGQDELFNIVIQVILRKNFSSNTPMIKERQDKLWAHCVATAFATLWLCRHLKLSDLIPKAFIAGLLHDIGKLCLLSAIEQFMTAEKDNAKLTPDLVEKILVNLHEKQGFALLSAWHLPDIYCRIARDHHIDEYEESDTLLVVVRLADMVCHKMDANNPQEDLTFIMGSRETDILGIKETSIALLEIAMEDAGLAKPPS